MVIYKKKLLVIHVIVLVGLMFGVSIFGDEKIRYTKFPKNFLGIDGNNMTKEKLIAMLKQKKATFDILIDEPPGHWIGSKYFIGSGLNYITINYVIYSFPDIGEYKFEIEVEFPDDQLSTLLLNFKKLIGQYNVGYETYIDDSKYYYWRSKNNNGIYEVSISRYPLFNYKGKGHKRKTNSTYLLLRWLYPEENYDKYAPIHR